MQSKNQKKKRKRNKKESVLTHRDIEALMGIHQDIYERHDHALRRKGR